MVRELCRKLPWDGLCANIEKLKLYYKVIKQQRTDRDKIYSLHEPAVKCYTKGKAHKKFEFGSKASIAIDQQTGIIIAAYNVTQTTHDSKTIPDVLEQCERLIEVLPKEAYVDRGYRGITKYKSCLIQSPKTQKGITKDKRNKHSKRAAIEPVISHLKSSYRMYRNFYKGIVGDNINVLLAAAAMNFKRVMNLWSKEAIFSWINSLINNYWIRVIYCLKPKHLGL